MQGELQYPELTPLLSALQAFSISYLQKKKMDEQHKTFLYQVINTIRELESMLVTAKKGENINEQLAEFRKSVWGLIELNDKQPDELKLDDKLLSMLTNFYLQTISTTSVTNKPAAVAVKPAEEPPAAPVPAKREPVRAETPKPVAGDEISDKIKLLEKSRIYLPPTKTASVLKLEAKYDEALHHLKNMDLPSKAKATYIRENINEMEDIIKKLESNTEINLTSIQAAEIRGIHKLLQELHEAYNRKVKTEADDQQNCAADIKNLRALSKARLEDRVVTMEKYKELGKKFLHSAMFPEAENTLREGLEFYTSLANEDNNNIKMLQVSALDLLGQSLAKQQKFTEARQSYQKAAERLKKITTDMTEVSILLGRASLAEEQEAESILKEDKDIQDLKQNHATLQKAGDTHLNIANKNLLALYEKLIDPKLSSKDKADLVNGQIDRWNKYINDRDEANAKAEWYTADMQKLIKNNLPNTLRSIREMFAAQAAAQQAASPAAMIEAKEKAKTEAQLRSEAEAKQRRDALLAKAEASRARVEAEKKRAEELTKAEAEARLRAEDEAKRARIEAEERAKREEAEQVRAKARAEELLVVRKQISRLMNEAKELQDKAHKNLGKHEYKTFLGDEEVKLKETLAQFKLIPPAERIPADLGTLSKCQLRLGLTLRSQGKFKDSEMHMQNAIDTYDELVKKQDYGNIASVNMKIDALAEMGRLLYMQRRYQEAQKYFNLAVEDSKYMLLSPKLDDSFRELFTDLLKQNKVHALIMSRLAAAQTETPAIKTDNIIETLYHYPALKRKVSEEEMKLIHQLLGLDKNLTEKTPRVQRLQEILLTLERSPFRKILAFDYILQQEMRNQESALDILDRNILKSYHEALINATFVEVLKNAAETLPADTLPLVAEIKAVRNELRNGQDVKLATLGLPLMQKIVYLEYERQLAEIEFRSAVNVPSNKQALDNIHGLLNRYKQELMNPGTAPGIKGKNKKKWSIGGVISVLKRKKKKPVNQDKVEVMGETRVK